MGSGSVGSALVRKNLKDGKEKTEILAISRIPVFFKEDLNFQIFMEQMMIALSSSLKEIHDKHIGTPVNISVLLIRF